MRDIFLGPLITAVLLISQYFLSQSKHRLLGGINPLLVIFFALWCFFFRTPKLGVNCAIAFSIIIGVLLSEWADGRKRFKKEEKETMKTELKKMQAHDLDD